MGSWKQYNKSLPFQLYTKTSESEWSKVVDFKTIILEKEQYSTSVNAIFTHKFKKRIHGFWLKIKKNFTQTSTNFAPPTILGVCV